jgi:hypothetical protein
LHAIETFHEGIVPFRQTARKQTDAVLHPREVRETRAEDGVLLGLTEALRSSIEH